MKKSAVKFLSKHGITKDDPDFKEVFGFVYRGASFALVSQCDPHVRTQDTDSSFFLLTEVAHGIGNSRYESNR